MIFSCAPRPEMNSYRAWQVELEVGGDGGVLEVPVIGGEEIELEVLGASVGDVLSVDHHAHERSHWGTARSSKTSMRLETGGHCL